MLAANNASAAIAGDTTDPGSYACDGSPANALIEEGVFQIAWNRFATGDQEIAELAYTRSQCSTLLGKGRWYFEGILSGIDERTSTAGVGSLGVGYAFRILASDAGDSSDLTLEPVATVGYESRNSGSDDIIAGGRVALQWTYPLDGPLFSPDTNLIGFLQPAYTVVEPTFNQPFLTSKAVASFSNAVALGVDFPSAFRIGNYDSSFFRVSVENQYIDNNAATNVIETLILAFRPVNSANEYDWNFNLYLSAGNGGYHGIAFGATSRF